MTTAECCDFGRPVRRDDGFVLDSGWDFVALLIRAAEHLQLPGIVNRSDQPVQAEGSVRCAKA